MAFENVKEEALKAFESDHAEGASNDIDFIQAQEATGNVDIENDTTDTAAEEQFTQAANVTEVAAQAAQEKDRQISIAEGEIEQLKSQLLASQERERALQGRIEEISSQNETEVIEEILEPPIFDISVYDDPFSDADAKNKAQADFVQSAVDYAIKKVMQEMAPTMKFAKDGLEAKERSDAIEAVSSVFAEEGINDFKDSIPEIERYIKSNPVFAKSNASLEQKYVSAYILMNGANKINNPTPTPKDPTAEELMQFYRSNPEFQSMVEKDRISSIKNSQQVPPFSASSGAKNAAPYIKDKPADDLREAFARSKEELKNYFN